MTNMSLGLFKFDLFLITLYVQAHIDQIWRLNGLL